MIDDGSSDGTPAVCDARAAGDTRIRVIHKRNEGPSAARNLGAAEASGDYLIFVDGDDLLAEGALEAVDNAAKAHGDPDLVVCCIERFLDGTEEYVPYDGVDALPDCGTGDELAAYVEKKHNKYSISPCRYAIDRAFYVKNGLSFMPGLKQEDELFTPLLICAAETFAVCRSRFYLYRTLAGSRNNTPTIENKLGFLTISQALFERESEGCSPARSAMLIKRGKYMFRRGIMEHNEAIIDGRKTLVDSAVEVYGRYPVCAEDTKSLCRLIKVLGPRKGIRAFLILFR